MTIGASLKRVEDRRLLTGSGRYVGDIHLQNQCEAVVLRSPYAYARIVSIDTKRALELRGTLLVLTASDLPMDLTPIPMRLSPEESLEHALQWPLAREFVRYVGEPVAVIVAENRYIAEDAMDLVKVTYEPLPPITDVDQSLASDAPILHPNIGSNDVFVIRSKKGSVDETLKKCRYVLQKEMYIQRHSGVPLETRGLVAVPEEDGRLTVYGAAKVVHFNRQILSKLLKKTPEEIRLVELEVGGGFGQRGEFYPEDYLIPFASLQVKRPVRWIEDRLEHLKAINHSREQKHKITVGFNEDGRILALRDEIYVDMGAYIRTHGITVPELTQAMLPGPYDIEALEMTTHVVMTNKTPTGTYRGPGRFEGTFVRETMVDLVAQRLGLDPVLVRERNVIRPEQMPYTHGIAALGQVVEYDSGDYPYLLDQVRQAMDWDGFAKRKEKAKSEGRLIGLGMAMFVEKSGFGPWEYAKVGISEKGEVYCKTGLADVGQGMETMLAQICGEQLGVPYEKINVMHGDTDFVENGNGSFATRGTVVGGSAAWLASEALKKKLLQTASEVLGMDPTLLEIRDEHVVHYMDHTPLLSWKDLIHECKKRNVELSETHIFNAPHMTYPYGVHAAEVEVESDTGKIDILKYHISYDVGRAVNPRLIRGQLIGGMAQGLGGAMYEEFRYDDAGQLLSGTFMDYLLPSASEVPEVEAAVYENAPSTLNPLGLKGAGEGGAVAVAPAIANAVMNALDGYPIEIVSLPIRSEFIRSAIKKVQTIGVSGRC